MPDMTVIRSLLLTQIKDSHGKVMYTYTAHHKIVDRAKNHFHISSWSIRRFHH